MPTLPTHLEIDRVLNLIRGFGWELEEKVITDTEIKLTVKKEIVKE
jgi:hypothetical protein